MPFIDDIRIAWKGMAQNPDDLKQDISGRSYWLWDPPDEFAEGDHPQKGAQVLESRDNRTGCVKIGNPQELEAYFYPVDKALIPEQTGGQCEGIIWYREGEERLCWIEMKMELTTHNLKQLAEVLEGALDQVRSTMNKFHECWNAQQMSFLSPKNQQVAITIPRRPTRLRQTPANFQIKAKQKLGGIKAFVVSQIELPNITPRRNPH